MKRFKKFLTEAEVATPSVMPSATDEPMFPTSMPNPFWFGTTPQQPNQPPQNQNPPPDEIDWDEIRQMHDGLIDLIKQINDMFRDGTSIDLILRFLRLRGINLRGQPVNYNSKWFIRQIHKHFEEEFKKFFRKRYPNATPQQKRTFKVWYDRFWWRIMQDYFEPPNNTPPGVDGTIQHGPPSPPPPPSRHWSQDWHP